MFIHCHCPNSQIQMTFIYFIDKLISINVNDSVRFISVINTQKSREKNI